MDVKKTGNEKNRKEENKDQREGRGKEENVKRKWKMQI